jgi:hypothetical protein
MKIDELFKKMNDTYLNTHPNIINMWKGFITKRHNSLVANIDACDKILETLGTKKDLTELEIITLYNLYNQEPN